MIDKLLDAIKDSYAQRFFVVVVMTLVVCYMVLNSLPVPEIFLSVWLFSLGYGVGILNEKALKTPTPQYRDRDKDLL